MSSEYIPFERKPVILKWDYDHGSIRPGESSFDDVLDNACEKLWEKQIQYTIRRIREMDDFLASFERELDTFIHLTPKK